MQFSYILQVHLVKLRQLHKFRMLIDFYLLGFYIFISTNPLLEACSNSATKWMDKQENELKKKSNTRPSERPLRKSKKNHLSLHTKWKRENIHIYIYKQIFYREMLKKSAAQSLVSSNVEFFRFSFFFLGAVLSVPVALWRVSRQQIGGKLLFRVKMHND